MSRVCREEEVIVDFEKSCFCAVIRSGAGLKWVEQFIGGEVGFDLVGTCSFKYFQQKGKVENGTNLLGYLG